MEGHRKGIHHFALATVLVALSHKLQGNIWRLWKPAITDIRLNPSHQKKNKSTRLFMHVRLWRIVQTVSSEATRK